MRRLVQELVPLVQEEFNTATDPAKVAFGGGSFAGERGFGAGCIALWGTRLQCPCLGCLTFSHLLLYCE